jgi:beta-ketoacyl synthase-like protein
MMVNPVLSSLALWTPAGVWTNAAPSARDSRADLTPWSEVPSLSTIHPQARRPHALAVALVQLAHVLLSAREAVRDAPPVGRHEVDLLLGTLTGSAAADFEFYSGIQIRGVAFGSPSTFVYTLPTAALAEIALALGVRGSLATLTAGSISGIASIARSASRISTGRARACICGGVEFASIGSRRASGSVEQDVIALFLVEAERASMRWPVIRDWQVGFAPSNPPFHRFSSMSPLSTLTALASAAVRLGASCGVEEVFGSSSDGQWAKIILASSEYLEKQLESRSL